MRFSSPRSSRQIARRGTAMGAPRRCLPVQGEPQAVAAPSGSTRISGLSSLIITARLPGISRHRRAWVLFPVPLGAAKM